MLWKSGVSQALMREIWPQNRVWDHYNCQIQHKKPKHRKTKIGSYCHLLVFFKARLGEPFLEILKFSLFLFSAKQALKSPKPALETPKLALKRPNRHLKKKNIKKIKPALKY